MIVEIAPELVFAIIADGNEIHARVKQGIGPDYELVWARMGDRGTLVLGLKHKNEDVLSSAPYTLVFESIDCPSVVKGVNK